MKKSNRIPFVFGLLSIGALGMMLIYFTMIRKNNYSEMMTFERDLDSFHIHHEEVQDDVASMLKSPISLSDVLSIQDECHSDKYTTIQKYGQEVWVIGGVELPKNTKSYHFKLDLFSRRFKNLRLRLLRTLFVIHHFCEYETILYTLATGNLISFYRDSNLMLPWDDDIDVAIKSSQWNILNDVWEDKGYDESITDDGKWYRRKIYLFNNKIFCYIYKPTSKTTKKGHYRLKFVEKESSVDIDQKYSHREGCVDIFEFSDRRCPGDLKNESNYPITSICSLSIRAHKDRIVAGKWIHNHYCKGNIETCISPLENPRHKLFQKLKDN